MLTVLTIILVLMAIAMIALILLQRGQGATAGAAFGAGASGTVFGARGASTFLTRATAFLAMGVFGIALAMAVMISRGIGLDQPAGLQISAPPVPQADATFDPGASEVLEIPNDDGSDLPAAAQQSAEALDQAVESASDLPAVTVGEQADDVPPATSEEDGDN